MTDDELLEIGVKYEVPSFADTVTFTQENFLAMARYLLGKGYEEGHASVAFNSPACLSCAVPMRLENTGKYRCPSCERLPGDW
jgi:hypothetical protein